MFKLSPDVDLAALLRSAEASRSAEEARHWAAQAVSALRVEPVKSFERLARVAGLDPTRHFRFADWSGVSFSGCNLRGFDFSGARLWGATFDGALIGAGPDRDGNPAPAARFDQAELSAVDLDREEGSTEPGRLLAPLALLSTADDFAAYVREWSPPQEPLSRLHLAEGAVFQDAPFAPMMVTMPSGRYLQGDERKPIDGSARREVIIGHRLAVARFPVTYDEWDFCRDDGGADHKPQGSWGRGRRPVESVSWEDITNDYLPWLNERLGLAGDGAYRLLTEAEWEYCCRAGTTTAFAFGRSLSEKHACFATSEFRIRGPEEVGAYPCNAWGLHDMHGNVWEWCQDVYSANYEGAPVDGTAREEVLLGREGERVVRGGAWDFQREYLRSSNRYWDRPNTRSSSYGFRVARTLGA